MADKGEITEDDFDRLGYPLDIDMHGNDRPNVAGIRQENQQRAHILSAEGIRKQRLDVLDKIQGVEDDKAKKIASQATAILACNEECEQVLYEAMKLPDDSTSRGRHALANAELKDFAILQKKLLKAFIHVRETEKLKYAGSFPQNKGKLKEAEDGIDNMIRRAFENRSRALKLQSVALVGEPSAVATDEATDEAIVPLILRSTLGVNHYQPSDCGFLTPGWISSIMSGTIVTGTSISETAHVWNDLQQFKEKASLLATAIAGRLPSHLHNRVKDKKNMATFVGNGSARTWREFRQSCFCNSTWPMMTLTIWICMTTNSAFCLSPTHKLIYQH
jgi:hypothetical protein